MKLLQDLPRNPRYSILLEPVWAIPGTIVLFYAPLYMKEAGLSDIEIGLINSVNLYFAFIFQLFAGSITNKLGRKRTTLIFDLIAWSVPMFIWAFSQNFWLFLIAYLLNATSKFVTVSFNCLIIEDVEEHKRSKVFAILNMIITGAGVLTPIAGVVIADVGIVPTLASIYFVGGILMTVMFFIRNRYTDETAVGKELMGMHSQTRVIQSLASSMRLFGKSFYKRRLLPIILITVLSNLILQLNFFQVIFFKEQLKFNDQIISFIPVVTAVTVMLLYLVIIPRLKRRSEEKYVSFSIILSTVGAILFLLIPAGNIAMLFLTLIVLAAGNFILQTYRDSLLMNRLGTHEKADMFSAVQTVMTLTAIPSGYLTGLLYHYNPVLLFSVILIFYIVLMVIMLFLPDPQKHSQVISSYKNM
ncbi:MULTISPECIES: MFS transporter [Paenibacillus]|uniref:MFS transporter n=1 Tax=Paenibacillus TaxID=44249 RepID=UPI000883BA37|nr:MULTISPECIES: MFS transporter [unclassified Paenibacillus]SDK13175.1 Major Facilitator Superfamily protein [Paenibacillus sp. OK060]SEA46287.1 Major Facilitator Superfamily protein [Paenibacillus sp. 276b]SHN56522.1 Major Facilitator Superfamily protein [Paenibacillus sp. ov031]SLJ94775.1 Major Facilitator Superfamily protein [Paenibacillus sp. RU5A]SOC67471.1 Major Facilitator Superfamily protein [Paenibacillus sp. RU26A]